MLGLVLSDHKVTLLGRVACLDREIAKAGNQNERSPTSVIESKIDNATFRESAMSSEMYYFLQHDLLRRSEGEAATDVPVEDCFRLVETLSFGLPIGRCRPGRGAVSPELS